MAQFLTIGRHFECAIQTELVVELELALVGRTEPVFELNLALIEKKPTNECRSDSGNFYRVIVLTSQVATFLPGQRCQVTES